MRQKKIVDIFDSFFCCLTQLRCSKFFQKLDQQHIAPDANHTGENQRLVVLNGLFKPHNTVCLKTITHMCSGSNRFIVCYTNLQVIKTDHLDRFSACLFLDRINEVKSRRRDQKRHN